MDNRHINQSLWATTSLLGLNTLGNVVWLVDQTQGTGSMVYMGHYMRYYSNLYTIVWAWAREKTHEILW